MSGSSSLINCLGLSLGLGLNLSLSHGLSLSLRSYKKNSCFFVSVFCLYVQVGKAGGERVKAGVCERKQKSE